MTCRTIHTDDEGKCHTDIISIREATNIIEQQLNKTNDEANAMLEHIKGTEYAIFLPETDTGHAAVILWN